MSGARSRRHIAPAVGRVWWPHGASERMKNYAILNIFLFVRENRASKPPNDRSIDRSLARSVAARPPHSARLTPTSLAESVAGRLTSNLLAPGAGEKWIGASAKSGGRLLGPKQTDARLLGAPPQVATGGAPLAMNQSRPSLGPISGLHNRRDGQTEIAATAAPLGSHLASRLVRAKR